MKWWPAVFAICAVACDSSHEAESGQRGLDQIEATSKTFIVDVGAARYDVAYGRLCAPTRAMVSHDAFERAMRANVYLRGATDLSIDRSSFGSATGELSGRLRTGSAGIVQIDLYLAGDDTWCFTGFIVGGTPALPTPGTTP